MNRRRLVLASSLLCGAAWAVAPGAQAPTPVGASALRWFKGNTHTHTLNSDGDSTPDDVVRWYRDHKYDFLVLTDHNYLTSVDGLNALHGADDKFLVIKGEEVSSGFQGKPLHINGLNPDRLVPASREGASVAEVLQKNVDAIRMANGVPHVNHPNFGWAITADDLAQVRNNRLFEVYNAHPMVNNVGGSGHPSLEQTWDALLSRGILLFGLATDDAHEFKKLEDLSSSRPGMGWVMVRAEKLEAKAIVAALDRGDFYASTGVELADYQASANAITVKVKQKFWGSGGEENMKAGYRIQFVGKGGVVLQDGEGTNATYTVKGTEGYVRARITQSDGKMAWTQPVMLGR
ncbi:hypothetical protein TBR22_A38040 [Luteitalea sp. TBR-22]|uniref:CehA/McbA family metallohydrolase n=1 Tax=Luteitalea sp. TBR-22 TaxID=2802971 RepID=UPI001AFC111A|nr:CehA/McbA family metallohydrolase [Luteitalea sp. TBR-22]BCS34576.1 hypothetical protein TBR22_A38040 [Luteitalea sp. TBR-22]